MTQARIAQALGVSKSTNGKAKAPEPEANPEEKFSIKSMIYEIQPSLALRSKAS
ncbi:hypothetical protein [Cupriavidus basilensis]|uniref:hypothetical protein n=1 Tax=Cupriavidus basilensis TaxID=68895 RepID=UPI003D3255D7